MLDILEKVISSGANTSKLSRARNGGKYSVRSLRIPRRKRSNGMRTPETQLQNYNAYVLYSTVDPSKDTEEDIHTTESLDFPVCQYTVGTMRSIQCPDFVTSDLRHRVKEIVSLLSPSACTMARTLSRPFPTVDRPHR
jgi:hypothetical protein